MTTFYRLLGFLRPYKRGMIISWTLASLAMVMTVALPALTGRAVQIISTAPSTTTPPRRRAPATN